MKSLFSTPNLITCARILLIPIFLYVAFSSIALKDYIAAVLFILLSLSDILDGYLARKRKQVTGIGKILDPIADKLLIFSALFAYLERIALWMVILILAREILITLLRFIVLPDKVIAASSLGKLKTFSQIVGLVAVMLSVPLFLLGLPAHWWLMLVAVLITILSGLDYVSKVSSMIGERFYTLPNIITTIRLLLIPLFSIALTGERNLLALFLAILFIVLDKTDGFAARRMKEVTRVGKLYDTAVDATGIITGYVLFFTQGYLSWPWILVFLVVTLGIVAVKTIGYAMSKKRVSDFFGRSLVGSSYLFCIAVLLEFEYSDLIMVALAAYAYLYLLFEFFLLVRYRFGKDKSRSKR